jgi:AmiR/NasT family two-component response regulator
VIDQAKGILIAREGFSADAAFDVLKRASQRANRKVHEIAQEMVDTATRPPEIPLSLAEENAAGST